MGLTIITRHVPKQRPSINQMRVPDQKMADAFIHRFCRCNSGKVGIVTSWKLVRDSRPKGNPNLFRRLYYGISYITGRDWQSYNPRPLSHGELQEITWAWGGINPEHTGPSQRAIEKFGGKRVGKSFRKPERYANRKDFT